MTPEEKENREKRQARNKKKPHKETRLIPRRKKDKSNRRAHDKRGPNRRHNGIGTKQKTTAAPRKPGRAASHTPQETTRQNVSMPPRRGASRHASVNKRQRHPVMIPSQCQRTHRTGANKK
jgi:hypothetical protein